MSDSDMSADPVQVVADLLHPMEGYSTIQSERQHRWLRRRAAKRLIDAYRAAVGLPPIEHPDEGPRPPDSVMLSWDDPILKGDA